MERDEGESKRSEILHFCAKRVKGGMRRNVASRKEAERRNREIEMEIASEREFLDELLLGDSRAMSTFVKHLKFIHVGFGKEGRTAFLPILFHNAVNSIQTLITEAEKAGQTLKDAVSRNALMSVDLSRTPSLGVHDELAKAIDSIWKEPAIQTASGDSREFQRDNTPQYILSLCSSYAALDYIPDDVDLLCCYVKSTAVEEILIEENGTHHRVIGMEGKHYTKMRWIHLFHHVHSIIFCVAVGMDDLSTNLDDGGTERLQASLREISELANLEYFSRTPILLVFIIHDSNGEEGSTIGRDGISKKFLDVCHNDHRPVLPFWMNFMDTALVRTVWKQITNLQSPECLAA